MVAGVGMYDTSLGAVTLTDDFDDNSLDGTKWGTYTNSGTVTEATQQLKLTVTANTSGAEALLYSANNYNFDETSAYVNMVQTASPGVDSLFWLQSDYGDRIGFICSGGWCYIMVQDGYADKCSGTICAESAVAPGANTWLRLREASGVTYFEYSTNNQDSYSTLYSTSTALLPFAVSTMQVTMSAYEWSGTGATTQNVTIFDNFNNTPVVGGGASTAQDVIFFD